MAELTLGVRADSVMYRIDEHTDERTARADERLAEAEKRLLEAVAESEREAHRRLLEAADAAFERIEAADSAQEREARSPRAHARRRARGREARPRGRAAPARAHGARRCRGEQAGAARALRRERPGRLARDPLQLGGPQQDVQHAVLERGEPALLELHARPRPASRSRSRSRARGRPAGPRRGPRSTPRGRSRRPRAPPRPRARGRAWAAGDPGGVERADLGAGQARVELDPERREGPPCRLGLTLALVGQARGRRRRAPSSASPWRSSQITPRSYSATSGIVRSRRGRWHLARLKGSRS